MDRLGETWEGSCTGLREDDGNAADPAASDPAASHCGPLVQPSIPAGLEEDSKAKQIDMSVGSCAFP